MTRWAFLLCSLPLAAQTALLPLKDVRAGMRGAGKTVFTGGRIEEFQVEVLGVLENTGPKQSLILARLSGGPLDQAGVLQGMSGSPVLIGGKLAGAVATAFAYSKEPIAGIRPIEEMLEPGGSSLAAARAAPRMLFEPPSLARLIPSRPDYTAGASRMVEIATPLSLAGFTRRAIEQFTPELRALGLEPMQGTLGGGRPAATGGPGIAPGSMISVQVVTGDLAVGADGTVTHIDGKRVYGFGHRFLSVGGVDMPFARAEVLTLLPALTTSFKISAAREWVGAITNDYSTAVAGEIGRQARMVDVSVNVTGSSGRPSRYRMQMVRDRLLTPFFLQMATFSVIDATERMAGGATVTVRSRIRFEGTTPPLELTNLYTGETAVPLVASLAAGVPLSYVMQSGFAEFTPRAVELEITAAEQRRVYHVDQLWTSRRTVRAGESVDLHVALAGAGGQEIRRVFAYRVPPGTPPGTLQILAADALSANLLDFGHMLSQPPTAPDQVTRLLAGIRPNNALSVRLSRNEPGFLVGGQSLPDPPPSLALLLARSPASAQPVVQSKLAEFDFLVPDGVVTGSKTATLEVKE